MSQTHLLELFNSEVMGGATTESFSTKGHAFKLTHVKVSARSAIHHTTTPNEGTPCSFDKLGVRPIG